ncbi:MAG TPA: cytochrome C, partial [Thauera sp.]|nr:cytochrome C [Thauera sp.]
MSRSKSATRLALAALSVITLAACSSEVPDTHPDQPVTKRQQAFKAMLRSFEPMGTMLKDRRYDADAFARMAEEFGRLR